MKRFLFITVLLLAFGCSKPSGDVPSGILQEAQLCGSALRHRQVVKNIPVDGAVFRLVFSKPADLSDTKSIVFDGGDFIVSAGEDERTVILKPKETLRYSHSYTLAFLAGQVFGIRLVEDYIFHFSTVPEPMDDKEVFPRISTDALLTKVQEHTFRYFWDYAHPVSGLARERLGSGETVTSGGSGFGLMAIPVGIERGFITREEGCERAAKVVDFLSTKADRFHGAFSHWLNGTTGKAIAFSTYDNGADLVETAFLMEGLLTLRAYFDKRDMAETNLRGAITSLWEAVEWDHFTRGGQNVLYWHWSPDYEWQMNMQIRGWNEALIVYVLAASSPTHRISKEVYDRGWAPGRNGKKFYDITLPLGQDYGGPLFFAHYSFMGLDPRKLSDAYADYWAQNVAHARINHAYCAANPKNKYGYSDRCWGLTASDIQGGYTASSPTNDRGTIAPTAALASMPYTPEESLAAMEYFYYYLGDRLWGEYGFYDAFCLEDRWFATSYIAIDQGPIVCMIENYRSGLLWNAFMKDPDIRRGLNNLGFSY
ncbi:MAG: beta-glucosidase [Bacteroidales bacterium]|nr:beta-glucosidase [Bacteroidales bacterium]